MVIKTISWLSLNLIVFTVVSCTAMFMDQAEMKRLEAQQREAEALQAEAEANLARIREIEAMPEGPEKLKRLREVLNINQDILDRLHKLHVPANSADFPVTESEITELEKDRMEFAVQKQEALTAEYRLKRPLATKVIRIEAENLETKYSNILRGLREIISLSGTLEGMAFADIEAYFVSFSGSDYLYISVFSPTVFNTLRMSKGQRIAKGMGVINKHWNQVFSQFIGATEDFSGYIIEMGYLTKNFASTYTTLENVEIVSFRIRSEDFLKLYNYEITEHQLLENSLVLVDGVRTEPE